MDLFVSSECSHQKEIIAGHLPSLFLWHTNIIDLRKYLFGIHLLTQQKYCIQ